MTKQVISLSDQAAVRIKEIMSSAENEKPFCSFLLAYNDFTVTALLLSQENQTMIPKINSFLGSTQVKGNIMFAVAAVVSATLPLFILVMFFQRQIVSGLTAGAVKG